MKIFFIVKVIAITAVMVFNTAAVSANDISIVLENGTDVYSLGRYLDILEDRAGEWTIEDVASPSFENRFQPREFNIGLSESVFWARFRIKNLSGLDRSWKLVDNFGVHRLSLYYRGAGAGYKEIRAGVWDGAANRSVISLPVDVRGKQTFYLRAVSKASVIIPLEICTDKYFLEKTDKKMLWLGIYFGIVLGMALYNLFLYKSLREESLLYYIFYVVSIALYFAGINGFFDEYFFANMPQISSLLVLVFLYFTLFWIILFTKSFLMTAKYLPRNDKVMTVLMALAVVMAALSPFVGYVFLLKCSFVLAAVIPVELVVAGVLSLKMGYRPARFFLIAFAAVILGALVYNLTIRGILPYTVLTAHGVQIGSAAEVILLSLALADRIKIMRMEKDRAQAETHQTLMSVIHTLAEVIEKRDPYTGGHTKRVLNYSTAIGRELHLTEVNLKRLELAAILHDVGKIGIRDDVLQKKGKLTKKEFDSIKQHTIIGDDIMKYIEKLSIIIPGIRQHHERYDGKGYPDEIDGENIDIIARIIAVADSFDAMTTDRPYRQKLYTDLAVNELKKNAGTQFDPKVVEAFLKVHHNRVDKMIDASGI